MKTINTILMGAFLLAGTVFGVSGGVQAPRIPAKGFAMSSPESEFKQIDFTRRAVGNSDVEIEILYSGICHSDIHTARGDWGPVPYPAILGHEICGKVVAVGKNVTKFKAGDFAGVGCLVGSCGVCEDCREGQEQYCRRGPVGTYANKDYNHGNEITMGGYSNKIVVPERFALKIPAGADLKRVAPLLCAGVTTYSPIRAFGVKAGQKAGVAGFGGLGHMAVQYLVRLGAEVTVFDITESKRADAARLGAKRYVNVTRPGELKGLDNSFDFILSTIPASYEPIMYMKMLKRKGELCIVGLPAVAEAPVLKTTDLVFSAPDRFLKGWQIGGLPETQEMLDYSVKNNIYPEVELIPATGEAVTQAWRDVVAGKVKFRYVIDMQTLK